MINQTLTDHDFCVLQRYAKEPRWVPWRREERDGKPTKVPYQASNPSQMARTNDPNTWSTADAAISAAAEHKFDGIGINLLNSDIAAFDIDHCIDPTTEVIDPWAMELVRRANTYCEVTPSGTGLRIIGTGTGARVLRKQRVNGNLSCESYRNCEKYITVTGNHLEGTPDALANIDELMDAVVAELGGLNGGGSGRTNNNEDVTTFTIETVEPNDPRLASLNPDWMRLATEGTGPRGINEYYGGDRSRAMMAFACKCLTHGIGVDLLASILMAWKIGEHVRDQGNVERALSRTITQAQEFVKQRTAGRIIIRVERGREHQAWRETQRAAIARQCQIFVRASKLVEPLWRMERSTETGREFLTMSLVEYNRPRLADQLAHNAVVFHQYDGRSREFVPVDPPDRLIDTLLERQDWDFPSIIGITNAPTMRPDGSLLTQEGYDPATQLWYRTDGNLALGNIPERPTKDDAFAALELFRRLIQEFPFDTEVDESVALAALLTVVLRGAFPVAPLFFIAKPVSGTGGSYFVTVAATLATGQAATPLIASSDPKELHKELSAKAREGRPIINLNNLTFDLESPLLCQMLTEGMVDIRPFGRNDATISCDCRGTTVFANGNNVHVVGDLVRRTLGCRLNAGTERPELREFKQDPIAMVLRDRGKYLAAAFTIARAHVTAGSPRADGISPLSGFEAWSKRVLLPLTWLGCADPLKSIEEARSLDSDRSDLRARIDALVKQFRSNNFTAADVYQKANQLTPTIPQRWANQDLFEAFSINGRLLSTKSIGKQLVRDLDRPCDNRFIQRVPGKTDRNFYRIVGSRGGEEEAQADDASFNLNNGPPL
jgi:putative DNA primase/helicase